MSKKIPLSQGLYATVDDEDYEWLMAMGKWHTVQRENTFYAATNRSWPRRKKIYMHRLVLEHHTGQTGVHTDHMDRDGLNNQSPNLRWASNSQNNMNKGPQANNASGFKGVSSHQGRWMAQIKIDGKKKHIGMFGTPEDAARAYDKTAVELHGEFACLNFPEEVSP